MRLLTVIGVVATMAAPGAVLADVHDEWEAGDAATLRDLDGAALPRARFSRSRRAHTRRLQPSITLKRTNRRGAAAADTQRATVARGRGPPSPAKSARLSAGGSYVIWVDVRRQVRAVAGAGRHSNQAHSRLTATSVWAARRSSSSRAVCRRPRRLRLRTGEPRRSVLRPARPSHPARRRAECRGSTSARWRKSWRASSGPTCRCDHRLATLTRLQLTASSAGRRD